jgi:hypothetical protein
MTEIEDFKVCRICLQENDVMLSILSVRKGFQILNILEILSGKTIVNFEETPKNICIYCLSKIDVVIDMIILSRKSEKTLSLLIEKQEKLLDDIEEDDASQIISLSPQSESQIIKTEADDEDIFCEEYLEFQEAYEEEIEDDRSFKQEIQIPLEKPREINRKSDIKNIFSCDLCDSIFISKNTITGHMKLKHLKLKSYPCNVCGKIIQGKSNFNSHLNRHTKLKQYVCEFPTAIPGENCNKIFYSKSGWTVHQRIHTGLKRFKCLQCPKQYTFNSDLRRHMYTHVRSTQSVIISC